MSWPRGVREPVVAGTFYPGSAERLRREVEALLAAASARDLAGGILEGARVRGVIVPHAGYIYSGPIAATAYALLAGQALTPSRLVLLGPSHLVPLWGLAVGSWRAWRTPLGEVEVDEAAREAIVAAGARVEAAVHAHEHSLEVQLPFIQVCFPGLPMLPVAVGDGPPEAGAESLAAVLDDDSLLVASSDLSHYHAAATARRLDSRTSVAIETLALEGLRAEDACGVDALRVALAWCRRHGAGVRLIDLRNSADTAGEADRVVGYGAFAVTTQD